MKDNLLEYSSCDFLNDVSMWYSSVILYRDHRRFRGRYIDGLMLGNGLMLAVEGMSSGITRYGKSRLSDSSLHGEFRFHSGNGFAEHMSHSEKYPLHYLQWISGPVYSKYPSVHGLDLSVEYSLNGEERTIQACNWSRESQFRIRRSNIVKNLLECRGIKMMSIDFISPETSVFTRSVILTNSGKMRIDGCSCFVSFNVDSRNWTGSIIPRNMTDEPVATQSLQGNELDFYERNVCRKPILCGQKLEHSVMVRGPAGAAWDMMASPTAPQRLTLIHSRDCFCTPEKRLLRFDLGSLESGESRSFSVQILTAFDEESLEKTLSRVSSATPVQHLKETYEYWTTRLSAADSLALPLRRGLPKKVMDYVDGLRMAILSGHLRTGGCIAHPYSYNSVFFRDVYDVFRALLELGHKDECRRTILFLKDAMNRFGIKMDYSPEEFHFSEQQDDYSVIEANVSMLNGTAEFKKSEYMLFFPMMIKDYHDRFADDAFAKSLYPDMMKTLACQPVEGDGLIAFSGDEISVKRGWPLYPYSSQNAMLYVQAASFVAKTAAMAGQDEDAGRLRAAAEKVSKATGKFFWMPEGYYAFSADGTGNADARLNVFPQALPFFYGALTRNDPRLQDIVKNVLLRNVFPSFNVSTLPIEGKKMCMSNGNSIGLLLFLMSIAKHPDAEKVFKKMMDTSGSMCTAGEYILVSNDWISRGEMLRLYESSFNLCAALEFLRKN